MFPLVLNTLSKGELVVHIDKTVGSIFVKMEKLALVKFPPLRTDVEELFGFV